MYEKLTLVLFIIYLGTTGLSFSIEYIFDEGRNAATADLIKDKIVSIFRGMDGYLSSTELEDYLGSYLYDNLSPIFLQQPVALSFDNLHPVDNYGANYARYAIFISQKKRGC